MRYIVQHRRATTQRWEEEDIVPLVGEIVIELDEINGLHKLKIGDGIHKYSELAYLMAGDEIVTQVLAQAIPRAIAVTLDVDKWVEVTCATDPNFGYYGQLVTVDGVTDYSRLDLHPDADMLAEFRDLDLVFVTENNRGVLTVYSVGDMPLKTYTMQATLTETEIVVDLPKIVGTTVGTPTSQVKRSEMGVANGVATLDADGKVPLEQLPEISDSVLEYSSREEFPESGESGVIYLDTSMNIAWRWDGVTYVEISSSITLGETSETAYAGDKGKANADAIEELKVDIDGLEADIEELKTGIEELPNVDGTSIQNVEGVLQIDPRYINYLEGILFSKPSIASLNVGVSGNKEIGTSISVSKFTHYETSVSNIKGNLTFKRGGTVLMSDVSPVSSSTEVTLSSTDTVTPTTPQTVTYTLSGTDTRNNAFSKSASISFYCPSFIGASTSESLTGADVLGLSRVASAKLSGTRSVTLTSTSYAYFVSTNTISSIKLDGFDVDYSLLGNVSVSINGVNTNYKVYRTTNKLKADSYSFVIT